MTNHSIPTLFAAVTLLAVIPSSAWAQADDQSTPDEPTTVDGTLLPPANGTVGGTGGGGGGGGAGGGGLGGLAGLAAAAAAEEGGELTPPPPTTPGPSTPATTTPATTPATPAGTTTSANEVEIEVDEPLQAENCRELRGAERRACRERAGRGGTQREAGERRQTRRQNRDRQDASDDANNDATEDE